MKESILGQRFGWLTVTGEDRLDRTVTVACDRCGGTKTVQRRYLTRQQNPKRHCGCQTHRQSALTRLSDLTGQRFGRLTVLKLTGNRDELGRLTWLVQCDCGGSREVSRFDLNRGWRLHCGCQPTRLKYPPAPIPYPKAAGAIVAKYLHLARPQARWHTLDQGAEDQRIETLLRVAWILIYRRSQGEEISAEKERRYIAKSLYFAKAMIDRQRAQDLARHCSHADRP